jgi:hypothetical protein
MDDNEMEMKDYGLSPEEEAAAEARAEIHVQRMMMFKSKLELSERMKQYDTPDDPQTDILAISVGDILESCENIVKMTLPRFEACNSADEVEDIMHDFKFELMHIVYHIRDAKYLEDALEDLS